MKLFRRSAVKNDDYLQKYVKQDNKGEELNLLLDSKTRWSSLLIMIERFVRIAKSVRLALLELGSDIMFFDDEITSLKQLIKILEPAKYAVDALCRRDATLLTAERINGVVFGRLKKFIAQNPNNNAVATQFLHSLEARIDERRNDNLVHLMEYLNDPSYFKKIRTDQFGQTPKRNKVLDLATELIERMFSNDMSLEILADDDNPDDPQEVTEITEHEQSIQEEIDEAISTVSGGTTSEPTECSVTKKLIKKEFEVYEESKNRTENLNRLRAALNCIQPTSVESERAFSAAGLFLTKLRTRLKPSTTNALCFLRHYFKTQERIEQCQKINWNPNLVNNN